MSAFGPQIAASYADPNRRECDPTYTLERQIRRARLEMGEERWQQLMAEWDAPGESMPPTGAA